MAAVRKGAWGKKARMKRHTLLRTNLLILAIILLGFICIFIHNYHYNREIFKRDIEHVALLTERCIYSDIDSIFTKPIHIALTMANDNFLKDFLETEDLAPNDEVFLSTIKNYLLTYKEKYKYDSVFLVSTKTNRYYHFEGVNRILTPDSSENTWYYSFLESPDEYALNIDNDEAAHNEIVVFINCKIKNKAGSVIGVVGVGFRVDYLQNIFKQYETQFDVKAYLIDNQGMIELSMDKTGFRKTDLFALPEFRNLKERILSEKEKCQHFWYAVKERNGYLVAKYVPNLEWYLIIDNDAAVLEEQAKQQFLTDILFLLMIVAPVLIVITCILRKHNAWLVKLAVAEEKKRSSVFQAETGKFYEKIYEIDITHNRAASEASENYFENLGVPRNAPYDEALRIIAQNHIKTEYRQGYLDTFSRENVLRVYERGGDCLFYDFMIFNDAKSGYHWLRITARIFYWNDDESVRMLMYRQNMDKEKEHEHHLLEKIQRDSLTGLYNKMATQEYIQQRLLRYPREAFAFFIIDIDNFKNVNDSCGHAVGDMVIANFAELLKKEFRANDIIGRIGGDEFVVFVRAPSREWVAKKALSVVAAMRHDFTDGVKTCPVSASIGVALAPEAGAEFETLYKNADRALYHTKQHGKNGFTLYDF